MYEFDLKGYAHKRAELLPSPERKPLTIQIGGKDYTEYVSPGQIINQKRMIKRFYEKESTK